MAKRFKLKFKIPSFQVCRSKNLSSFPGNPLPAIYRLSPVNPKAHDIGYPNLHAPSAEHHCKKSSKIMSVGHGCQMCCDKKNKVKSRGRKSTSSVPSTKSDFLIDSMNEEESETLISCFTSFSDEIVPNYKPEKELISKNRRNISSVNMSRRVRFQTLENRGGAETMQVKKMTMLSTASSMTRSNMEGNVKESFAVVKKSKDPYEDFKKSMLEMITEMEISEAEDLEQLLQCFLALNSRSYHAVIVRAFMEIWQQMFVWNPTSIKNLQTDVKTEQK